MDLSERGFGLYLDIRSKINFADSTECVAPQVELNFNTMSSKKTNQSPSHSPVGRQTPNWNRISQTPQQATSLPQFERAQILLKKKLERLEEQNESLRGEIERQQETIDGDSELQLQAKDAAM